MIYNQYHANLKYEIWKCTLKKGKTCRLLGLTPRTKKLLIHENKPPLAMIIKIKTWKT